MLNRSINNKAVCGHQQCTGCGLCLSLCPQQCISIGTGELGHVYPQIDADRCTNCGLCQRNCPALHSQHLAAPQACYAVWSKDVDDYRTSSSGGVASVLSRYVIEQGGIVYGCAMLPDIDVRHVRIDNAEDLWRLKGSKYVQSDVCGVYRQLKEDVKAGRNTLFIGTPCQVAAVKAIYKVQPENLLLVDLICHGVPSRELLKRHVKNVTGRESCDNIMFRESDDFMLKIKADGVVVYDEPFSKQLYKDCYINTFIDGYTYRDCCFQCQYAGAARVSDITIGDFWGLGMKYDANGMQEHSHGCSVVLPITEKGIWMLGIIQDRLNIYERPVDEAIEGNAQLQSPVQMDWRKRLFRILYPAVGRYAYDIATIDRCMRFWLGQLKRIIMR